jgi:hypothetical protein
MKTPAPTGNNGRGHRQVLQQNKPYYYVVPFACNGGDNGTDCSNVTPYSGHEILTAYDQRGLNHIHGRKREG